MSPPALPGKAGVAPQITFDRFLRAIVGQESGGDYTAQSPAGALGRYQVLASNVPGWSREALGYSITPAQFLHSPQLQDRIAQFKLRQYFDRYGPAGAAAAWYSGDPGRVNDTRPVAGGPSVKQYVQEVLQRAAGGGQLPALVGKAKDALGAITDPITSAVQQAEVGVRNIAIEAAFVVLGLGLLGLGAWQAVGPGVKRAGGKAAQLAAAVPK